MSEPINVDFNDKKQREAYFIALFDAEIAEISSKQKQRHHLFYEEREVLSAPPNAAGNCKSSGYWRFAASKAQGILKPWKQ